MKPNSPQVTLKDFSALSFDSIEMKAAASPEVRASQPRLAPESAGHTDVQSDGRADGDPAGVAGTEAGKALLPIPDLAKAARVLIVDDERNIRESLAKVLRAEGYDVQVAENGEQALARYEPGRTDLVLLDLNMPVKNGWDTLNQMVSMNPCQAIIIITGKSPEWRWASELRTGTLIEKPIDMTELLQCMKRMLEEPDSQREKRVEVQRTLTRLTRPLTCTRRFGPGHPRGGINE